jgi:hypothetical protein
MWRRVVVSLVAACGGESSSTHDATAVDIGTTTDAGDPSLVAHYKFDDDPADGVRDSSGNGHSGTCHTTCPMVSIGKVGAAYTFNSTSDLIDVMDAADLRPSTSITISVWVMTNSGTGVRSVAGKRFGTADQNSWQLIVDSMNELTICATPAVGLGRCDKSAPGAVTTGAWHHLAMVWNGSNHLGYVDGLRVIDAPVGISYDAGLVLIGGDINNNNPPEVFFGGRLDELRIYGRALNDNEVAALAGG